MILIQIYRYNTPNKHKLLFLQQIYLVFMCHYAACRFDYRQQNLLQICRKAD